MSWVCLKRCPSNQDAVSSLSKSHFFFLKPSTYFMTTLPFQSLQPLRRDKEAQVSHVSFSCHLPMCCYCTEHWDWGVCACVCARVCRWCSAQRLSLPCNREESNQLLTASASSSFSEAAERGSHQSQKGPPERKISFNSLSEQHPALRQNPTLSLTDIPWAANTTSCAGSESPPC